ncbi:hypothetical protein EOD10_18285 [Mesorhizobium sp. M7A.T.Ca.TU.009.01.3.2]|nr:hypothetical protein EJ079_22070 [Mesorhizobium sp. M7A.F.Ce.TU.012.03.2.1]RUT85438.1 hypothetical protein EOD14_17365 [Mesorhizobium sp. M7A.T.Ca.US.000.02.1.1]RUT93955.1 hypothetical protein EOD15_04125 [Mesorhizobium sp. M7A.T.Ca.US.000.02.2.1]RUU02668.1 hypothetical protein EOD12_12565 [Mesorhizobium sp. M7A.T.Ca.TU.009.02.1.1]RUU11757.1 hypothetical protein EOD10_18285 [Mesorhizobium sp. M7A.T.Ca.TU.009.01.3.2]RUU64948.1 hypothetical protein EOC99_10850 [Mesorhizobium sp. M7A.T.Ca.TU.0
MPCEMQQRRWEHRYCTMWKSLVAAVALVAAIGSVHAASAVNKDAETRTLVVTEGGSKTDLALAGGETVEFCPNGCFVTLPNGDLEALTGSETIEISGGVARIK